MKSFYILSFFLLAIVSCQEEEDIEQIEDVNTTTKNTSITSLVSRISKNPTAFDDFIDQNEATRVEFPFSVILNNSTTINLNSDADYQTLIQELESTAIQDEIQVDFPATVSLPDYQSLTVNNATELQNINWNGFDPSEINCLSVDYLVEIISYNNLNIEQEEFDIDSDTELYNFLANMPNDEFFYQLEYPISIVIDSDQSEIESATELENAIANLPQSCFEPLLYDNQPPDDGDGDLLPDDGDDGDEPPGDGDGDEPPDDGDGDEPPDDGDGDEPPDDGDGDEPPGDGGDGDLETFTNFIIDGTFAVSFLTSDGEEVFEFEDAFFRFDGNGNILENDDEIDDDFEIVGQWSATLDNDEIIFELDFDDLDFDEVNDDWQVVDFSNGETLSLIDESSDGDDDELVLDKL